MPITEQLQLRAVRMLTDNQRHAAAAIDWASRVVATSRANAEVLLNAGFTHRELSLGAEKW